MVLAFFFFSWVPTQTQLPHIQMLLNLAAPSAAFPVDLMTMILPVSSCVVCVVGEEMVLPLEAELEAVPEVLPLEAVASAVELQGWHWLPVEHE